MPRSRWQVATAPALSPTTAAPTDQQSRRAAGTLSQLSASQYAHVSFRDRRSRWSGSPRSRWLRSPASHTQSEVPAPEAQRQKVRAAVSIPFSPPFVCLRRYCCHSELLFGAHKWSLEERACKRGIKQQMHTPSKLMTIQMKCFIFRFGGAFTLQEVSWAERKALRADPV